MPRIYARPAADRATAELLKDPARPDAIVAAAAGCSGSVVFRARAQLEAARQIPGRAVSWAPRDRVVSEITRHPARSDRAIAAAAGCSRDRAARVRRVLERSGQIPPVSPADRAEHPRPRPLRRARDRAVRVLSANPWRSDVMLARAARVSVTTITKTRHQLEATGQIPHVPASRRERLHVRAKPSAARRAIVLGARSSREVADAAQVSMSWAWKARRTQAARPRMPPPPLPPQPCEHCGNMFVPTRRQHLSRPQRYCSKTCASAAHTARKRARRPPPEPRPPKVIELPNPPSWEKGTCTRVPPSQQGWWTSDDPFMREAAAFICETCPVIESCLEWSLALPSRDNTIYAGLGGADRRAIRAGRWPREARRLVPPDKPSPRNLR